MNTALEQMWNSNWRLSQTYKYVLHKNLPFSKAQCVAFYRASYKLHGTCGSYDEVELYKKFYTPKPSRRELISEYSARTGMFGSYASWLGLSVTYFLLKYGYEPLNEAEIKHYKTY